jgi:hypothetical protein
MYKLTTYAAVIRLADRAFCWPGSPGHDDYMKWAASGGVAQPADAPPSPIDLSNPDNHERAIKALALCIADVGGLTVPQMKALFKTKWDSLA